MGFINYFFIFWFISSWNRKVILGRQATFIWKKCSSSRNLHFEGDSLFIAWNMGLGAIFMKLSHKNMSSHPDCEKENGRRVNMVIYHAETENAVKSWRGPTYHGKTPLLELRQRLWNNNDLSVGPVQGGGFACSLADRCCNALQVCLPPPFISNSWLRSLLKWDPSPFFFFRFLEIYFLRALANSLPSTLLIISTTLKICMCVFILVGPEKNYEQREAPWPLSSSLHVGILHFPHVPL